MENNKKIGSMDTLMIAHALVKNGYKPIRADIRNHRFKISRSTDTAPSHIITMPNPYRIRCYCSRDDNSVLSKRIFNKIDLEIKNQHNEHNTSDEYMQWKQIKNSNSIIITTFFYDKKELIKVLNALNKKMHEYENK